MKILKKIGLFCLTLVICLFSCFKFVNAEQSNFVFNINGPTFSSLYSYITFAYVPFGNFESVDNSSLTLSGSFYEPITLDYTYGTDTNQYLSVSQTFLFDRLTQNYSLSQIIQGRFSSLPTFAITYHDLYVYNLTDFEIPNFSIDIGTVNYEQSFTLTYEYSYYNTSTKSIAYGSEQQPLFLNTLNNRLFTFDVESTLVDLLSHDMVNTDASHGGLGYIEHITFYITPLDSFSSNYVSTIEFSDIYLYEYGNVSAQNEFFDAISSSRSSGVLGWLLESIDVFMSAEIFPNFSIGTLLGIIVSIPILIYVLRLFMGG